jgi:hypothetical protein
VELGPDYVNPPEEKSHLEKPGFMMITQAKYKAIRDAVNRKGRVYAVYTPPRSYLYRDMGGKPAVEE